MCAIMLSRVVFTQVVRLINMMDFGDDNRREFRRSHPWITFGFDPNRLTHLNWMRIGEALSKCDHIGIEMCMPWSQADDGELAQVDHPG